MIVALKGYDAKIPRLSVSKHRCGGRFILTLVYSSALLSGYFDFCNNLTTAPINYKINVCVAAKILSKPNSFIRFTLQERKIIKKKTNHDVLILGDE